MVLIEPSQRYSSPSSLQSCAANRVVMPHRAASSLYELDIQIDRYFVTNENPASLESCIPGQTEIFAIDLCAARYRDASVPPGILRRRRRSFYIESDPSCDTVNRQVAFDGKLAIRLDLVGLEREQRILLHIEEVGALQMCIALIITRFDRGRFD